MGSKITKCFCGNAEEESRIPDIRFGLYPHGSYTYRQELCATQEGIAMKMVVYYFHSIYRISCPIVQRTLKWCDIEFIKVDEDDVCAVTCYMKSGEKAKMDWDLPLHRSTMFGDYEREDTHLEALDELEVRVEQVIGSKNFKFLCKSFELLKRKMPVYYVPAANLPKEAEKTKFLDATYKKVIADQAQDGKDNLAKIREQRSSSSL